MLTPYLTTRDRENARKSGAQAALLADEVGRCACMSAVNPISPAAVTRNLRSAGNAAGKPLHEECVALVRPDSTGTLNAVPAA